MRIPFSALWTPVNGDNPSGSASASWVFDIDGISDPVVSIDMAAMGDFEATDSFSWTASVDGAAPVTLFTGVTDESDEQSYVLDGGSEFLLSDPMTVGDVVLNNVLQTLRAAISAGSELQLTLTAIADGGSEAIVFRNIIIGDLPAPPPVLRVSIPEIQGSGTTSPLEGQAVTTTGVVTADFRALNGSGGQLAGFFIQDAAGDGDDTTSDGILVFTGAGAFSGLSVAVGDLVEVTGRVQEAAGTMTRLSEISAAAVLSSGSPLAPTTVLLPELVDGELERVEGMLVEIASPMVVAQNFFQDRYGQLTLAAPGVTSRPLKPTQSFSPHYPAMRRKRKPAVSPPRAKPTSVLKKTNKWPQTKLT